MKTNIIGIIGLSAMFLVSCGGGEQPTIKAGDVPKSMLEETKPLDAKVKTVEIAASVNHREGMKVYNLNCKACHQSSGLGYPNIFPPLAKSDFLLDKEATIKQILQRASGEMVVNGEKYNGEMHSFSKLSDQEIVNLLNFVYNSWGNVPIQITAEEIASLR